jgi:hypothetical protein
MKKNEKNGTASWRQDGRDELFGKLSAQQKLEGLEKINRFLYYFTPRKSKEFAQKLKGGRV